MITRSYHNMDISKPMQEKYKWNYALMARQQKCTNSSMMQGMKIKKIINLIIMNLIYAHNVIK